MSSDNVLQKRVEELESRVAFQEDLLQTLNTQLAQQQQAMEQQQQMMQVLYRQWREIQDAADGASAAVQERPPHY